MPECSEAASRGLLRALSVHGAVREAVRGYFVKDSRISQLGAGLDDVAGDLFFTLGLGGCGGEEGAVEVGAALGAAELGSAGRCPSLVGAEEALQSAQPRLGAGFSAGLGAPARVLPLVTMVAEKPVHPAP